MNFFEVYYDEFIKYATKIVAEKEIAADPMELVSEAYVQFADTGDEFHVGKVKKLILGISFAEVTRKMAQRAVGERDYGNGRVQMFRAKRIPIKGERWCNICKDSIPVNGFRLMKFSGFEYLDTACKKCRSKQTVAYFKKNRLVWNAYMRKRYDAIPKKPRKKAKPIQELWNKANKKRYAKEKELLLDSYIRRVLKAGKKPCSPQDIERKRQELFSKRRMAKAA